MANGVQNTWSTTANSNATADDTINWAEGQAPSTVNNSARALMAAVAEYRRDISGMLVTGGTSTAYTLTTNEVLTLADGVTVVCRMSATSGAAPTLNVDGTGAVAIQSVQGTAVATGALLSGGIYKFTYYASSAAWIVNGYLSAYVPGGTDVAVADGGTGASTAAAAATNLGLGTGDSPQFTAVNLSHASDNTLTGSSGDAFIEGNRLFRVGGTDVPVADGGTGASNASDARTNLGVPIASQAQIAAETASVIVTAEGMRNHPGVAKFWAYVTVSGGTPTLQTSNNVTSITDTAVGQLTVTIATDFSSANWPCHITCQGSSGLAIVDAQAAGSVLAQNFNTSGVDVDPEAWAVSGFGVSA
jgi:hypothetical protein